VINASAWSWAKATDSAAKVSGHPSSPAGLPGDVVQDEVVEQPDRQPVHVAELPFGIPPGQLATAHRLVEKRQHLRAKQRRSQELMFAADRGLVVSQPNGDIRADHIPGHGRSVPPAGTPRERLPILVVQLRHQDRGQAMSERLPHGGVGEGRLLGSSSGR